MAIKRKLRNGEVTRTTAGTRKWQQYYWNENNKQKAVPLMSFDGMIL
jgi:hypothetical protein